MEVINIYADSLERPKPFQCWECYQPPAYYILAASVYKSLIIANISNDSAWKIVQLINPILSILVLFIFYRILLNFNITNYRRALYLSFLAVLPRDIFTSTMIGNDYLLVFTSVAAVFYYLKTIDYSIKNNNISITYFSLLSFFVIIGSLTKQHGLLLLILPFSLLLYYIVKKKRKAYTFLLPLLIIIITISINEELWKYQQTGKFLVSNQDFFNYAENQFPGSINLVEFNTFRLKSIFENPFISSGSAASLPTELFARTFFDYEYRFLSPKIPVAIFIGRFGYSLGLVWILFFITTTIIWFRKNVRKLNVLTPKRLTFLVLTLLGFLFVMVPILQTIRYPYFSSMKSMFMLPGVILLILAHAFATREIKIPIRLNSIFVGLNLLYGIVLIISIAIFIGIVLNYLHGPLWQIPSKSH
jgi:hypothetical protein